MRRRSLVVLGVLMAMVMATPTSAIAGGHDQLVYGPNTQPHGVSYEAWTRRFARYLFEPPVAESPIVNPTCDAVTSRGGIVFMPVATPVCSGRTASTMRLASDAKARPMPTPRIPVPI